MRLPSLQIIFLILLISEFSLALFKRAGRATGRDRLTLPLLWLVICGSIWLGFYCRARFPAAEVPVPHLFYILGLILFVVGMVIRWIAIIHLGRFFTVNVAIALDHQLVTDGPYKYVRHPSYTGAFLIFLGMAFCLCNFYAMAALLIPVSLAFLWRMKVEEAALRDAFGVAYARYSRQTGRLFPRLPSAHADCSVKRHG